MQSDAPPGAPGQARFKTQSTEPDPTAIAAGGTVKTLNFSGGALGSSTSINLNTLAGTSTPTTFTGGAGTFSTNFASGSFTIDGTNVAIRRRRGDRDGQYRHRCREGRFCGRRCRPDHDRDSKTESRSAASSETTGAFGRGNQDADRSRGRGSTVTFNADAAAFSIVKADGTGVDIRRTPTVMLWRPLPNLA